MHFRICLAVIGLCVVGQARSQPLPLPTALDRELIENYIEQQVKAKGLVGLSVAIVRDGKVVLAKGFGKTAISGGDPVTVNTPFAIGSVTKQFACASVFLLAEDGKLTVRDKVSKFCPDLTRASDISLLDCMNHVSGYPDYYPLDFLDRRMRKVISADNLLREYAGGKLDFEPGARFSYSNTGYILLGRVVEKVGGEPFPQFLDRRVFQPLKMTHSKCDPNPTEAGLARGHTSVLLGPTESAEPEAAGWLHAAGGIYSTASDLATWDLALMSGQVLRPESWRLMTAPRTLGNGKVSDYGCGLSSAKVNGEIVLQHNGAVSGFHAYNAMIPRTRSAVIVLSNAEHIDSAALHRELLQLLIKEQGKKEVTIPAVQGPSLRETCIDFFKQLQAGKVDRASLGEEFSLYLTDARIETSKARLAAMGSPTKAEVESTGERGGMEAARVRLICPQGTVKVNIFRSPDGKIQQFLLTE
ncbi:MAG: beta-lactamase family protein [Gemmataceae bacterium]|nr:beta-lactamase family protein [Gemmataceae bacterium]